MMCTAFTFHNTRFAILESEEAENNEFNNQLFVYTCWHFMASQNCMCKELHIYAHVCLSHEDEHLQFFTNIAHKQWNVMIKFYL